MQCKLKIFEQITHTVRQAMKGKQLHCERFVFSLYFNRRPTACAFLFSYFKFSFFFPSNSFIPPFQFYSLALDFSFSSVIFLSVYWVFFSFSCRSWFFFHLYVLCCFFCFIIIYCLAIVWSPSYSFIYFYDFLFL